MDFMRPPVINTETSSAFRITVLVNIHIFFGIWIKHFVVRLPLGLSRLLAVLPLIAVQIASPWFFDKDTEPLQVFCITFIVSWLGLFKVLAFCWGRAPLRESMTVAQIAASLALPLFPKPVTRKKAAPEGRLQDSAGSGAALVATWLGKTALGVVVVLSYMEYRDVVPAVLKHYLLAFTLYSMSGILMDGPAALVVALLELPVLPTFDQPWMSASLAEFWARRWNVPTTSVLRTVLYDTCVEGSLINPVLLAPGRGGHPTNSKQPQLPTGNGNGPPGPSPNGLHPTTPPRRPRWSPAVRRQLGLHLVFFVSGAVHEYMAWLLTGSNRISWKWTVFFWIQAPLLTLESLAGRAMRRAGLQLPRPVAIVLTHLVLQSLAYDLFFGYMEEQGISLKVVGAISDCIWAVLRPLQAALMT